MSQPQPHLSAYEEINMFDAERRAQIGNVACKHHSSSHMLHAQHVSSQSGVLESIADDFGSAGECRHLRGIENDCVDAAALLQ